MRMTQNTAFRRPQQSTTDAAEMRSKPSVVSDAPARWQTHPGYTLCPYPTQSPVSMVVESAKKHPHDTYSVSQKNPPPEDLWQFFENGWEFFN